MEPFPRYAIAKGVTRGVQHVIIVIIEPTNLKQVEYIERLTIGETTTNMQLRYRAYVEGTDELIHENLSWPMIDAATDAWLDGIARGYDMGVLATAELYGHNTLEATRTKTAKIGPAPIVVLSSPQSSEWTLPDFGGHSPAASGSEEDS